MSSRPAGVIPYYVFPNGTILFLLQLNLSTNGRQNGWSDFGGKPDPLRKYDGRNRGESSEETAVREMLEELGCLPAVRPDSKLYGLLARRSSYGPVQKQLVENIIRSRVPLLTNNLTSRTSRVNSNKKLALSAREQYKIYFYRLEHYLPIEDIPPYEDMHIDYSFRHKRECRWFTIEQLRDMDVNDYHMRLRIAGVGRRLPAIYRQGLLVQS